MRALLAIVLFAGCAETASIDPAVHARLEALVQGESAPLAPDVTNAWADDYRAAALGQKLFFDPRFSGPLLDHANDGLPETLGQQGETGRVSCAGCHVPRNGSFVDSRSTRGQLSLASSWTGRRTPGLLDLASASLLTWDGRRDTAYSVVFGVIENPIEFNSSRLFVAQQIARLYAEEYEQVFAEPVASLDAYPVLEPAAAGCTELRRGEQCLQPGTDDEAVTRVVVNMGKAIAAYTRQLRCGPSRFDAWMNGDEGALDEDEIAGAVLFIEHGCDGCHSGPELTDQRFHNVGMAGSLLFFTGVDTSNDPGAIVGLAAVQGDWLNSRGPFSDGDDGRLDAIPADLSSMEGAFRTPSLRCIGEHRSFMHNGEFRSLHDVVRHFESGGGTRGFVGTSELAPFELTDVERDQLVAFLRALEGPGADPALREMPVLPP